ncbi:MAG: 2-oxoglutarate dehydrogenase complex dihydrolipoyllysine-residue succinyltransferase [Saprospiraceae bacterium]
MSLIDIKVPPMGESISEVTLSKWLKKDGDMVKMDEPICEFESDKATLDLPAEAAGKIQLIASDGDDLKIGAVIAKIDTSVTESNESKPIATETSPKSIEENKPDPKSIPSPAASKIIREQNIDADKISGTGKEGRITKEDATKSIASTTAKTVSSSAPTMEDKTASGKENKPIPVAFSRVERREKMTRMRRTISKRLVSAKNETAMLTTFNEVDMSAIMALRAKYQDQFVTKYGIKLGFMSLFAKACAKVLIEMPEINAFIDGEDFIYHDYADISIAISTPTGLVVPPIKNVESLKFSEIEHKIKELADKARNGKLTLDEMSGGTFTITNGGIFGSMMSTPILNEPQSAILGMHAIIERPVAIAGEINIRPMMYLALSYDHRVIDGSSSVTFLVKVKKLLEDPMTLMLEI